MTLLFPSAIDYGIFDNAYENAYDISFWPLWKRCSPNLFP
jgi:hypothetical protein